MKAPRWWMRVPELVRRLIITSLATLGLFVALALILGMPAFAFLHLPGLWILGALVVLGTLGQWRRSSKIEDWERAKREHDTLDALDALHDWRTGREDDRPQ